MKARSINDHSHSVRKHAALIGINGSLTDINVEKQRAEHAQKRDPT